MDGGGIADPLSNSGSTAILHVQPDGVWRIDYQLRGGDEADVALRDENVAARLQAQLDMMGGRAACCMVRKTKISYAIPLDRLARAIAYEFLSHHFSLTVVDSGGSGRIRAGLRAYPRPKFASTGPYAIALTDRAEVL